MWGLVVSASEMVRGEGVFHAQVVHKVGGVVVVVEVFVAPDMSLDDLAGLDAIAAGSASAILASRYEVGLQGRFAVAVRGAEVVAIRTGDWAFADETFDGLCCQDT